MNKTDASKTTKKKAGQSLKKEKENSLLVWDQAIDHYDHERYEEAIPLFTRVLQTLPKYVKAYDKRGSCFYYLGDNQKALEDFNKAMTLDRKNSNLLFYRAMTYFKMNDFTRAVQDLNLFCKSEPDLSIAYISRGIAYYKMGNLTNATMDLSKAIELDPKNEFHGHEQAYLYLVMIMHKKGNQERAKEFFNRAMKLRYFHGYLDEIWELAKDGFYPALEYLHKIAKAEPVKKVFEKGGEFKK